MNVTLHFLGLAEKIKMAEMGVEEAFLGIFLDRVIWNFREGEGTPKPTKYSEEHPKELGLRGMGLLFSVVFGDFVCL